MPIISRFYGIVIYMYWRDHAPPHFHAKYQDDEITMAIETGKIEGTMARRAIALLEEWRQLHKDELMNDWQCAMEKRALQRIAPLE